MAKKKTAEKPEGTLQSVVDSILDKDGNQTLSELFPKVQALRADVKAPSVGQCLHKWRQKKGHVSKRGQRKAVRVAKRAARVAARGNGSIADTLRKVAALAEIVDIPSEKLADVIRLLS